MELKVFDLIEIKMNYKNGKPIMVVCMDLETYNRSLESFMDFLADESFNNGFEAGQNPYPSEEELEEMETKK